MAFPTTGTLSYTAAGATVTFDALTSSRVNGKCVPTADKRSVAYVEWTIEVKGWATAASLGAASTDDALLTMRNTLTQPAGQLVYTGKGFGPLSVNAGGNVADVAWGPWPEIMDWMPIGSDQTALVQWRVVARIPQGKGNTLYKHLMEVAYNIDTTVDIDGYTEIAIDGQCSIAMTRAAQNNPGLPDNVDQYRSMMKPPPIPGFQRVRQHFTSSPDRRTLRFNFLDRELPADLPTYVTQAPMTQSISSDLGKGFVNWSGSISGTITLARGIPKAFVWSKFLMIVSSRLGFGKPGPRNAPSGNLGFMRDARQGLILLTGLSMEEEIFGRGSRFSVNYRCLGAGVGGILLLTNLWKPIAGTDAAEWQNSLKGSSFNERGYAKIGQTSNDDKLVDLVQFHQPKVAFGSPQRGPLEIGAKVGQDTAPVTPANSWIFWECQVIVLEDDRQVFHKPLGPQQTLIGAPNANSSSAISGFLKGLLFGVSASAPAAAILQSSIQSVGAPIYDVILVGRALRLQYDVTIPTIQSFGGVPFKIAERRAQQGQVGAIGGFPVKAAQWSIRYRLTKAPANVPLPANPMLQLNGQI